MTASNKPRVLHVVESLEVGGLERLVHDLVLARGGESTSVACVNTVGPFGEALRKRGIAVELIGEKKGFLPALWRTWRHLLRVRPDVVHCHNLPVVLRGGLGAMLASDIPLVVTKHGALRPGNGIAWRLNRILIRRADVVAVSPQSTEIMKEWMAEGGRPVRYIANGISLVPYERLPSRDEARAHLGLPARSFVVGIVARVSLAKGHLLLLDVFAQVLRKLPGALLLVVGDGVGLASVETRIHELGVGKSVLIMGMRRDVPAILAAMDVFCLPSEMEGMPMTVLEAMAAGLPVVASNVGGIPEVVEEGRTGLMVRPCDPEALETALLTLADDPEGAREMGRAGRQRLFKKFSLEQTLDAYERLYQDAVERRSGPKCLRR